MKKVFTITGMLLALFSGCSPGEDEDGDGFVNCASIVDRWPRHDDAECLSDPGGDVYASFYDGFNPLVHDCDDTNPDISPGAVETCDGLDNDCDGFWDEGEDANDLETDCDGDGYVKLGSDDLDDCDPWDAAVHPDAEEIIDGRDNDCDGVCAQEECSDDPESGCPCREPIDFVPTGDVGCTCSTTSSTRPLWLLVLVVIGLRRRVNNLNMKGEA